MTDTTNEKVQEGLSQATTSVEDPLLNEEVTFTLKVSQVNILLNLLGELPYVKAANAIQFFRENALAQLQAKNPQDPGTPEN